ncbi:serine hydrolase domain-containing protein [Microvirga subterranea]|uniref:CubicO group peptidase (Beta-lactamase class C family) n=1 Tax=Microvirga subterranea TaxID=186651 RepID=A0A370HGM3_9HYPH|nr:serine hydrolase domain-containing protein [Microvirga subterranea]RDI56776.1 CubicO group peptidase (beta-lactamase class C family) [Microvirga subterranea]
MECWAVVEGARVVAGHEADRPVPWWSFTKTVLAAAALVLVRDGSLALEEPLPGRSYTLRHLLQHRSGVANYGGVAAYHEAVARGDEPWPVRILLERTQAERLRYPPGEGWDYSNIGYLFVRQLVEEATGEPLDAALRRLVLAPLGIRTARIASAPADLDQVPMGDATGYHPGWVYHGLMVGSVEEAALLLDRLLKGGFLPDHLLADMRSVHALPGPIADRQWVRPGYGLGLMSGEVASGQVVEGHTGGGPGSTIAVYRTASGMKPRTAAYFATTDRRKEAEDETFRLLEEAS